MADYVLKVNGLSSIRARDGQRLYNMAGVETSDLRGVHADSKGKAVWGTVPTATSMPPAVRYLKLEDNLAQHARQSYCATEFLTTQPLSTTRRDTFPATNLSHPTLIVCAQMSSP